MPKDLLPNCCFNDCSLLNLIETLLLMMIFYNNTQYRQQLPDIVSIRISRWIGIENTVLSVEYHVFSDASLVACSAVVYSRISKAAPINKLNSASRISPQWFEELCVVVLLANVIHRLINQERSPASVFAWCDSSITLTFVCLSEWSPRSYT